MYCTVCMLSTRNSAYGYFTLYNSVQMISLGFVKQLKSNMFMIPFITTETSLVTKEPDGPAPPVSVRTVMILALIFGILVS